MKIKYLSYLTIFLILIFFVQVLTRIFNSPLDYDEAYNLQVSLNIQKKGSYSTFERKFDPNITTGPTVLIPASIFLIKNVPLAPRITMLLFVFALIYICQKHLFFSNRQKFFFLFFLNIIPLGYFFSSHVLGETPGFVLMISSLIFLNKQKFTSGGILYGLSILTKNIYFIGFIPIVYIFLASCDKRRKFIKSARNLAPLIFGTLTTIFSWEFYKLAAFNFNIYNYKKLLIDTHAVANALSTPHADLLFARLDMIQYVFNLNSFLFLFISLFISYSTCMYARKKRTYIYFTCSILYILSFLFSRFWFDKLVQAFFSRNTRVSSCCSLLF